MFIKIEICDKIISGFIDMNVAKKERNNAPYCAI